MLIALFLFALDGLGIALAPTFEIAVALRILGGLASAVIIPNAFALVSSLPRQRHAAAMGVVMLGMTAGIATGPAIAGVLTGWIGWRAPFLLVSAGCLAAFLVGRMAMPGGRAPTAATVPAAQRRCDGCASRTSCAPARQGTVERTGVAAFLLSGEVLRLRYALDVAQVGLSTAAFGIGLAVGNLSAGALRRLGSGEECALVITNVLLVASVAAFYLPPLPLWGALACLAAWEHPWGRRPLATTVLASRSDRDKGAALAAAET